MHGRWSPNQKKRKRFIPVTFSDCLALSTSEFLDAKMTAHLVILDIADHDGLLARACEELHDQFGIEHMTLQLECGNEAHPCARAVAGVV